MAADLDEFHADWLAKDVRETRNSTYLVAHLRRQGTITPALYSLLADMAEGKVTARPKLRSRAETPKNWLPAHVDQFKAILRGEVDDESWEAAWAILQEEGLRKIPETKREVTEAARLLTAMVFKLTPAQLDEALSTRTARKKNR